MKEKRQMMAKAPVLEEVLYLGHYCFYLVLLMEFMVFAEVVNLVFMVFAGVASVAVSCADEQLPLKNRDLCTRLNADGNCSANWTLVSGDFHSIVDEWNLICDKSAVVYIASSALFVGLLFGSLVFGQLSNVYGRETATLTAFTGLTMSGAATALSWDWKIFLLSRLSVGVFLGGVSTTAYVFFIEFLPIKRRFCLTTVVSRSINLMLFALLAYCTSSWRQLALLSNLICTPGILLVFFAYESPRWLLQQGRRDEAGQLIRSISKRWASVSVNESLLNRFLCSSQSASPQLTPYRDEKKRDKQYTYWHLFSTAQLTIYTFSMVVAWLSASVITYALMYNVDRLAGDPHMNMIVFGAVGYVVNLLLVLLDRLSSRAGRKAVNYLGVIPVLFCCLGSFAITLFEPAGKDGSETALRLLNACAFGLSNPMWLIANLLTVELFPTPIRNVAHGLCSTVGRFGAILAPQLPYLSMFWLPTPYLITSVLAVIDLVVFFFFVPETKGKPLDDRISAAHSDPTDTKPESVRYDGVLVMRAPLNNFKTDTEEEE